MAENWMKRYKKMVRLNRRRLKRALRKSKASAEAARATPKRAQQKKSAPATTQTRSDEDISSTKKARKRTSSDSTAQEQTVATPGDIVPIVFCKRSTDGPQTDEVGGVWMQPQKIKQASHNFVGIFLYPLSQGQVVSTPTAPLTYVGEKSLTARGGTTPTLTNYYRSAATMAAAPNVCPITSGKIFCHPDATSFVNHTAKAGSFIEYHPDFYNQYFNEMELTIGSDTTTNTTLEVPGANLRVFEIESGDDRTSSYWTVVGASPSAVTFAFNLSSGTGRAVGTKHAVYSPLGVNLGDYLIPAKLESDPSSRTHYVSLGSSAEDKPVAWEYSSVTVNTQTDTSIAATDNTLGGVVKEVHVSPVADPTSFDSSYDFTDYADITFLEIQGDLYDESDHVQGEYKTTTRQLSVLIEKGVQVALYSAGTPGSTDASHHFVDLAMHLFALNKRVVAGTTADIASPIDTSNLQAIASFHTNFGLFFNGIIEQSVNIIDFISTMAPFYFVSFVSEDGRYAFKPVLPLTSGNAIDVTALTPTATFTDADIIAGSFEKEYVDGEERRDVQISVVFCESQKTRVGLQKSKTVRYSNVSSDARVVQYDMTDCCVTARHARNFAKLQLATRKHSTHSISFDISLLTSSLSVTDIIKVQRLRKNNVGDDRTESNHYQVTSITHGTDGTTTIGAMHFPLNSSNIAEISNDVINGSFTVN
tara:strand:- start:2209 stop:4317 length:2109 start_codon:yes stop_codon:yes gene_type:complete